MFTSRPSSKQKTITKSLPITKPLDKMGTDILLKICENLNLSDTLHFFTSFKTSPQIFEKIFDNKNNNYNFLRMTNMLKDTVEVIYVYKSNILNELALKQRAAFSFFKGYDRAECFIDILKYKQDSLENKMLALYILLRESNGKLLKSMVREKLTSNFGASFFNTIETFVRKSFAAEYIIKMEKILLTIIHSHRPEKAVTNRFGFSPSSWPSESFMKTYMDEIAPELFKNILEPNKDRGCAIS